MILVRDTFQLKVGQMDKVLPAVMALIESDPNSSISRVLTDISGRHFTLVLETKIESIDAHRKSMKASFARQDPEQADRFSQLVEYGQREYYTIEYEA